METATTFRGIQFSFRRFKPRGPAANLWALAAFLLASHCARATVTPVGYWRMGENDAGASFGLATTNVTDIANAHPLVFQGAATYSSDLSPSAARSPGSSLSVSLTNSAYGTNTVVSTAVDNFGIECWAKPTALTAGGQVIVYNGVTGGVGSSGWGIIISAANTYQGLLGGKIAFGTNAVTSNAWTHLALVRAGGTSTLYINGVGVATALNAPTTPAGNFAVATAPQTLPGQSFTGLMDEVRVFTFAAGQFSTNDLLLQHRNLVVTNLNDSGPGSLRNSLAAALDGDSITFATNGIITLSGGELPVTKSVTISGPGAAKLGISAGHANRIFHVAANNTVTISSLTIQDGALSASGLGGGVYNAGNLTLNYCTVSNNAAGDASVENTIGGSGGALYNATNGIVLLNSCTFFVNHAGTGGDGYGGLLAPDFGTNGAAGGNGGAIFNEGFAKVVQCTIAVNTAGRGGMGEFGRTMGGTGGVGGSGGGIFNAGALQVIASTIATNYSGPGGAGGSSFSNDGFPGPESVTGGIYDTVSASGSLLNTIVGLNFGGIQSDLTGSFTSLGHNLIERTNGATGFTNGIKGDLAGSNTQPLDPNLGTIAFYGGDPTALELVLALLSNSPALDAGDDAVLSPPYSLTGDQRNLPRKTGAHVDIGAYESDVIFSNPVVTTQPITPFEDPVFGYWSAALLGTVNPGGYPSTVYFDYGATLSYGLQAPSSTLGFLNFSSNLVSAIISNLMISQTYHYRVVASNSAGIFTGNDQTFTITPPSGADLNGDGSVDASELATALSHLGTNRVSVSNVNQVLLNYLNGDPLLMTNVAGLGSSNVTFGLSNSPAVNFTVQSSTNLTNWQNLGPAQLIYRFTDTNAPLPPNRLYRLVYP